MANGKLRKAETRQRDTTTARPFDEADWVDWDHWQTVEEIQNFMNALSDERGSSTDVSDDPESASNVATQIRRHGLQADG